MGEWQKKHVKEVHRDKTFLVSGTERGNSLPGLASQYFTETLYMKLADINAEGIDDKLQLPHGEGSFDITDDDGIFIHKTRTWEWKPADGNELSEYIEEPRQFSK